MVNKKLFFISIAAFLVSASYSLISPLKVSVLSCIGGYKQLPFAELLSLITLIIFIPLYSKFMLKFKNRQAPIINIAIFALAQICVAFVLNFYLLNVTKVTTFHKILCLGFYNFIDLHAILIIGGFWSFASFIHTSKEANKNYYLITGVALAGGLLTNIFCLSNKTILFLMISSAILLFTACLILLKLTKYSSQKYAQSNNNDQTNLNKIQIPLMTKLIRLVYNPYLIGILILFFSYEFIIKIYNYRFYAFVSDQYSSSIAKATNFVFRWKLLQTIISIIGIILSHTILNKISLKIRLSLLPTMMAILTMGALVNPSLSLAATATTTSKGLYSGIYYTTREMLYIPSIIKSKFQIRTFVESFGKAMAIILASISNLIFHNATIFKNLIGSSIMILSVLIIWTASTFFTAEKCSNCGTYNESNLTLEKSKETEC